MRMDWLVSLQTFGTSYLYPALKLILKLCYIVTIPLHYPIYYLLALVVFLLSPIWYILQSIWRVALAVVGLVTKLKYLYIYLACAAIIGICAGFILRGTSSFIFVSLGIDTSSQKAKEYDQSTKLPPAEDDEDFYEPESGTRSEDSSSRLSIPGMSSRRARIKRETKDDAYEMFEKQWKLLRSTEKPRRRRRGLLSQTIHEESSSDLS